MADLIDRKQALKEISDRHKEAVEWFLGTTNNDFMKAKAESALASFTECYITILKLPSAEPEIIRCKDCKWCVEHYDTDGNVPYWICKNWDGGTDADGFCYEAERRTDE